MFPNEDRHNGAFINDFLKCKWKLLDLIRIISHKKYFITRVQKKYIHDTLIFRGLF